MAYWKEFRAEVLSAWDSGDEARKTAVRFGVSESWIRWVKQQRRETGQIAPKEKRNRTPGWRVWSDWLLEKLDAQPDLYVRELKAMLKAERNIEVCEQTICNACAALNRT